MDGEHADTLAAPTFSSIIKEQQQKWVG